MDQANDEYVIITDGACMKNPGPGGWGLILVTPEGHVQEYGGREDPSTNNRMELVGLLRGLQEVFKITKAPSSTSNPQGLVIRVVSDSKYVLEGAEKNLRNWRLRDWKTVAGDDVKNRDLWERIERGLGELNQLGFKIKYERVKGHAGNEGNERADQIAVKYSRGESIDLFAGTLANYPISVKTGAAFELTYLSYVDGKLTRHRTWPECQKAVEGKAGAKFKKVKNSIEERDALKAWGLSA